MTSPTPSSTSITGHGRICVWPGGILWIGVADGTGTVHAHHALQLSFGDDQPPGFRRADDVEWTRNRGCIIPANLPHAIDTSGGRRFANIFVDPETAEGRALRARTAPGAIAALNEEEAGAAADLLFGAWAASPECARLEPAAREVVRQLAGTAPPSVVADPRVLGAIELVRARLDGSISLTEVARDLNISPSRLRHLFSEQVGLPFRTYVLWLRLQRVIRGVGTEKSLTHAALAAGFADAAHMTRTFRRMVGIAPTTLDWG